MGAVEGFDEKIGDMSDIVRFVSDNESELWRLNWKVARVVSGLLARKAEEGGCDFEYADKIERIVKSARAWQKFTWLMSAWINLATGDKDELSEPDPQKVGEFAGLLRNGSATMDDIVKFLKARGLHFVALLVSVIRD